MTHIIFNGRLSLSVDSHGAQLRSVKSAAGIEYLWQGDGRYWADSSPLLFPYIARLYGKGYTYNGDYYAMGIHGFAAGCEFEAEDISTDSITLTLRENAETLRQYPFRFRLSVTYSLCGPTLRVAYRVENMDDKTLPFAIGGHPGFNVPFAPGTKFEDCWLCFDESCAPYRVGFTEELFLSGEDKPYPLEDGRILRLSHSLFDDDAIILKNTAKGVALCCEGVNTRISMAFPGFDYFGIWHRPNTDAPYVCLEPWTSLPSRQGIVEELTQKPDMIMLHAGDTYENHWTVTISEE